MRNIRAPRSRRFSAGVGLGFKRLTRFDGDDGSWSEGVSLDPSMREVRVTECWLRVDLTATTLPSGGRCDNRGEAWVWQNYPIA